MDKYEYKIRTEEIKTLIAKGKYAEAVEIADGIDWRRVKSVMMLCTISDLYKVNRRYEDSRDLLLLAYDRHPGGRSIVYSLCELSVKMGEFVQAVEYYKEFVQIAPRDNGRYVLQYKLYEAQDVSLEERIEVLEELKSQEYIEKWAYELAYLYHRVGLATKCVEECDELILWFGEGKYVMKAMELKMLHEPLTSFQQEKYDLAKGLRRGVVSEEEQQIEIETNTGTVLDAPTLEMPSKELDIQVKVLGVGQYDTINMQKELAEHLKELWEGTEETDENGEVSQNTRVAFAKEIDEVLNMTENPMPEQSEQEESSVEESASESVIETEVFFGETGDMDKTASLVMEAMRNEAAGIVTEEEPVTEEDVPGQMSFGTDIGMGDMKEIRTIGDAVELAQALEEEKPKAPRRPYEKILGMEYDGQISMLLPESEQVEKQITGQINLEDVLRELEKRQKESEQKFRENVEQRVLQQTGAMFTEFEASIRDGLLEQLEREKIADSGLYDDYVAEAEPWEEADEIEELAEIEENLADDSEEMPALEEFETEEFEVEEAETEELEQEEFEEEESEIEEPEAEEFEEEESEVEEPEEEETETEGLEQEEFEAEESETEEPEAEEFEEEESEVEESEAEESEEEESKVDEPEVEEFEVEESEAEGLEQEEFEAEESEVEEPEAEETEEEEPEAEEPVKAEQEGEKIRSFSPEEQELFGSYAYSQKSREQIINAIDNISMASYTGNVIITGDENMDVLTLAKNLVKEVQTIDNNFSGKTAKISGVSLNQKDIEDIVNKMSNGALIVQKAAGMSKETATKLCRVLEQEERGVIVLLVDAKKAINTLIKENPALEEYFTIRIDVEALSNKALVELGTKYAKDREYSIDEMGVLALHTAIADRQSSDHLVTVEEVQRIIDEAISRANRKTVGHFFDILIAKRYDDEDMIILREKDFV